MDKDQESELILSNNPKLQALFSIDDEMINNNASEDNESDTDKTSKRSTCSSDEEKEKTYAETKA